MRCPRCQSETRSEAKYCGECGATLVPLPEHIAEKIRLSRRALEGERKHVTILFADLKASMELLAGRDPEEARRLLDPVLERMMEAVHQYEGTVNQVMGDGIMALFGAPVAHEDHAVRACYAALRMQDSVKRYAAQGLGPQGVAVEIRVGINSGEVVVGAIGGDYRMDYTAVGQATHLAARMEQLAPPGSILVTADVLRAAEGRIHVRPLGLTPIKGFTTPVEVYEVTGARTDRWLRGDAAARDLSPFVGREAEMEILGRAAGLAGEGRGQVVAVMGEPGVGKTRLLYEFIRSHRLEGWLVLATTPASFDKTAPYLSLIDLMRACLEIEGRDEPAQIREKIVRRLLALGAGLPETQPALLALLDAADGDPEWLALDPLQRRQLTIEAVRRLLLRTSQIQPLCLVVENLHWIDAGTEAALDSIVEVLSTARLLLLTSHRPEYEHRWGPSTNWTQLRIEPLSRARSEVLLHAILGHDEELEPLRRLLIERTEGNPFFIEESVRTLVETQALIGDRGGYRLAGPLARLQVPVTVHAVLAARLDRLPPDDKALLQAAAVIGKDVPLSLLEATTDAPEDSLRRGLAHLQAAEFLQEASLFPDLVYTFKHALTHEVAYRSLLQGRRQQHHRRIAETVVERFPETAETRPELVAHHYTEAGLAADAVAYWQRAGLRSAQRAAYAEATAHLSKGLELVATLSGSRDVRQQELDLQTALAPVLMATRGYTAPEVAAAYGRARALCEELGDTPRLYPVLWGLWAFYLIRAELQTARDLAEQLLRVALGAQDSALLVEAHYAVGDTLYWLGDLEGARAHFEQSIRGYDPVRHGSLAFHYGEDPKITSLSYLSWTLWSLGFPDRAVRISEEALALAQDLSHPPSRAFALFFAARLHLLRGDERRVRQWTEALVALSEKEHFAFWSALGAVWEGWTLARRGREEDGIAQMRRAISSYRAVGAKLADTTCCVLLAETLGKAGWVAEGLDLVGELLANIDVTGERNLESELHRLRSDLLLALDATSEAEASLDRAVDCARRQGARSLELRAATSFARLCRQQGKREDARRLLTDVYGSFDEGFDTRDLQEAGVLLDELTPP